jgi:hypothetical protein
MLERASVRYWLPIIAAAGFFPIILLLTFSVWLVRSYTDLPATSAKQVATASAAGLDQEQVGAAALPSAPTTELVATLPDEQRSEGLTALEVVAIGHSAYSTSTRDIPAAELPAMSPDFFDPEPVIPTAALDSPRQLQDEALAPPAMQDGSSEGMIEARGPSTDETVTGVAPALPMFATFAVAPPSQFFKTVEEAIPVPKPKPDARRAGRPLSSQSPVPRESRSHPSSIPHSLDGLLSR